MNSRVDVLNARVTYRRAPIHTLERFTFKDLESAYQTFSKSDSIKECVILQTCNRVEVYAACERETEYDKLVECWADSIGLGMKEFKESLEVSVGKDATLHLLKLASGLDSLLIGEDQILGQVKRSFDLARNKDAAGPYLGILFDKAIRIGSKVRRITGINRGSVSYGSMAVKLAEEHLKNLRGKTIMLIGTGEAASLVAKALKRRGIRFLVTSRTIERAKSFSQTVGGESVTFEKALQMLKSVDALFVAATAPYYLVTFERIDSAMRNRRQNRGGMVIVDLSNPRTVEEKITTLKGVKLINIDEVSALVEKNMKARMHEVKDAQRIIEEEVDLVQARMKRNEVEPVVDSLFKRVDTIRERELEKALDMLSDLNEEQRRTIEQLSHAIVEGVLSNPMDILRRASEGGDKELVKAVSKLFKYE